MGQCSGKNAGSCKKSIRSGNKSLISILDEKEFIPGRGKQSACLQHRDEPEGKSGWLKSHGTQ